MKTQWNRGHDWGIYSVPCLGSEGGPAGGERLLQLQQPRAFHLWLPTGEGIQNWPTFKLKGGDGAKEGSLASSRKGNHTKGTPGGDAQGVGHHVQTPFLNPDAFHRWYWIENVARVRVNGEGCMALLDNGMQINTITLGFVENSSLDVRPLSDLVGRWVACIGLGNALTQPMGYVIILVQVNGVQGYDENQIALVIPDMSDFAAQVPVILGTPTISHVVNVIKEKEIHALAIPWLNAQVAYLLAVWWAKTTVEDDKVVAGRSDPTDDDEVVITNEMETIGAFLSHIIHAKTEIAHTGMELNVMTQALHAKDGSLPQGLTIQNTYTELCSGCKNVTVVVRNSMAYPQTLKKDSGAKGSCSHLCIQAAYVSWDDGSFRWGPRPADAKAVCETKAGEIVWQAGFEWIGILATWAGRFHPVSPGWISWCLCLGAQWTLLYPFNWTCD